MYLFSWFTTWMVLPRGVIGYAIAAHLLNSQYNSQHTEVSSIRYCTHDTVALRTELLLVPERVVLLSVTREIT